MVGSAGLEALLWWDRADAALYSARLSKGPYPRAFCLSEHPIEWVRKPQVDTGLRHGVSSEERDRIKALEGENRELRRADEILKLANFTLTIAPAL